MFALTLASPLPLHTRLPICIHGMSDQLLSTDISAGTALGRRRRIIGSSMPDWSKEDLRAVGPVVGGRPLDRSKFTKASRAVQLSATVRPRPVNAASLRSR